MKRTVAYITIALLLAVSINGRAQSDTLNRIQAPDTLATAPVDSAAVAVVDTTAVMVQESLIGYKMQSRYRPVNQPFVEDKGFFSNMFIMLVGSGYKQFAENYSNGPYITSSLGKWFTKWHGAKLSTGIGYFWDNYTATRVWMADTRLSYMFNLTGYVDGYNPNRLVEFYPLAGLGLALNWDSDNVGSVGPSAHIGLDVNMHIFPGIDLVVEPIFELQNDSRNLVRMDIWRNYLFAAHMGYGLRIFLDPNRFGADPGGDWFFTLSSGPQLQFSSFLINENRIRFSKALGDASMFGVGRRYSDTFALRAQLGYSWHFWKEIREGETDEYDTPLPPARFRSSYFVGRLEGVVDVLRLFNLVEEDNPFSVSLLGGPEIGVLYKKDPYYKDIVYPYVGFTVAPQAKYTFAHGISVFVEPRVSIVPYSAYAFMTSTVNRNYYDGVVSMSLGVEYRLFGNKQ